MTTGLYLPKGAMPKDVSFAQLVKMQPVSRKLAVVGAMYDSAEQGNVRAAQWLAQVSGEWSAVQVNVLQSSPMIDAVNGLRAAMGLPALGEPQAIDAEATLVSTHELAPEHEAPAPEPAPRVPSRKRKHIRSDDTEHDAPAAGQPPAP